MRVLALVYMCVFVLFSAHACLHMWVRAIPDAWPRGCPLTFLIIPYSISHLLRFPLPSPLTIPPSAPAARGGGREQEGGSGAVERMGREGVVGQGRGWLR
jgi:hypothetical protein